MAGSRRRPLPRPIKLAAPGELTPRATNLIPARRIEADTAVGAARRKRPFAAIGILVFHDLRVRGSPQLVVLGHAALAPRMEQAPHLRIPPERGRRQDQPAARARLMTPREPKLRSFPLAVFLAARGGVGPGCPRGLRGPPAPPPCGLSAAHAAHSRSRRQAVSTSQRSSGWVAMCSRTRSSSLEFAQTMWTVGRCSSASVITIAGGFARRLVTVSLRCCGRARRGRSCRPPVGHAVQDAGWAGVARRGK